MPDVCGAPDRPFAMTAVSDTTGMPATKDTPQVCSKDSSGCRLALGLGKSDVKTDAVIDVKVIGPCEGLALHAEAARAHLL